jgi:hypothetical protein
MRFFHRSLTISHLFKQYFYIFWYFYRLNSVLQEWYGMQNGNVFFVAYCMCNVGGKIRVHLHNVINFMHVMLLS